jgi:sigma-B regulation protein RsbU (phosphoserine phosphatase)
VTLHSEEVLEELLDALVEDDPVQLYESAPCGYLSADPDGVIVKTNRTLLTMTGYDEADLVGRRFVELLTAGGRIYHESHYMPLLHLHGSAREIAMDLVCADGHRLPVLVNAVLERNAHAQPRIIRMAVFDATHRREYERELLLSKARAEQSEAQARALAQTLQQTLIPPETPHIPGLDVGAVYRPAGDGTEVGGDFYDVFRTGPDDWVVTLGDVSGKGVEAAVVTALVRYTIRAAAVEHSLPAAALQVLNTVLLTDASDRFCTVVLLRLRRSDTGFSCELAVAGHPLPLLRRPDGSVREVGEHGSAVGLVEDPEVPDTALSLEPGDTLVLFTDGVPEARRDRDFYGLERLMSVVAPGGPAQSVADRVVDDVVAFQEGSTRDDAAVVVLVVPAAPAATTA